MVVDDVEENHQPGVVRGVDQAFQPLGPAIGDVRRIEQHAVIAPAARAGELRHGAELDGRHADVGEVLEMIADAVEGAAPREGADVQLVEHRLVPGAAAPLAAPLVGLGVDEDRWPVHIAGLGAGGGVGDMRPAGRREGVFGAGLGLELGLEPAFGSFSMACSVPPRTTPIRSWPGAQSRKRQRPSPTGSAPQLRRKKLVSACVAAAARSRVMIVIATPPTSRERKWHGRRRQRATPDRSAASPAR